MLGTQVFGAGGQEETSKDWKTAEVTIRLQSLGWILKKFPTEEVAKRFMADHPNIKIDVASNQDASLNTYMLNWASGDVDVDLCFGGSVNRVAKLAYRDFLAPWNDFYKGDFARDKFVSFVTELAKKGDEYYAIPLMVEGMALEANKSMMIEAGLSKGDSVLYPKTLDELYEFSKKLTKGKGEIKDVYGFSWNFSVFGDAAFLSAVNSTGGKALNDDGSPNFNEPKIVEVFNFIKRVTTDGYGATGTITDANAGRVGYMANKVAIIHESSARAIEAKPKIGDDAIVLPWPGMEENGSFIYSHYAYITRPAKPAVVEAIFAFFREQVMGGGHFAQFGAEKYGKLPSFKKNYETLGSDFDEVQKWINMPRTIGSLPWVEGSKMDSLLWELEQAVVTTDLTGQQAWEQLKERGAKLDLSVVK